MTKHVLLTGGLGFIGGHTVEHWLRNTDWDITVLDSLRFAGRTDRLTDIETYDPDRVTVLWHDLRSEVHPALMRQIGDVDYIVNMASDSHVDRSIADPVPFVQNNVMLALNTLEYARKVEPEKFIQISTDEVYGPAYDDAGHAEWATLKPSNPYSASKAAQENIAFSYWRTYGVPVIITNTMNNVGERQDVEKYVPMVIKKVMEGDLVQVHGAKYAGEWTPGSRVWLHARNHADALMFLLNNHQPNVHDDDHSPFSWPDTEPSRFHIAGEEEIDNLEMAKMLAEFAGKNLNYEMVDFHSSRPGHDLRYALDGEKIRKEGWVAPIPLRESIKATVDWYADNPEWLQ